MNGLLYGTTITGGSNNDGAVFVISPSGTEQVLYSFAGGTDGLNPIGNLIYTNGTLYGVTELGGEHGLGTVFTVSTSGSESVLYSFKGQPDGANPAAGLTEVNGALYGTTGNGGVGNVYGTVFEIDASGNERVLHSFGGDGADDGTDPQATLLYRRGMLYGTTTGGGNGTNAGTVFSITLGGKVTILHSFLGSSSEDGAIPTGALVDVNGTLYGTTLLGGVAGGYCGVPGCGTVFSVSAMGTESVLYSFKGQTTKLKDGEGPLASLINMNGSLYGTTSTGGSGNPGKGGYGTVFKLNTSGVEKVMYSFQGGSGGSGPQAGLTAVNGSLYGSTYAGGRSGAGTIFALTP